MGVMGTTPILDRFSTPVTAAASPPRWAEGLCPSQPAEWDARVLPALNHVARIGEGEPPGEPLSHRARGGRAWRGAKLGLDR